MARALWTGVISFGLVSVPVALYSATREHEVSFHQFQKGTKDRIRYQRVNERTGKEVDYADIVKGSEVGDGRYVMVEQGELEAVAPGRSRSLDIHAFVNLDEIDPIYFQKTYYLGPASDETAKTYALLRDAMAKSGRTAIGTLVMRGKEYLTAIRATEDILVLETMYFADEIRDPQRELDRLPGRAKVQPAELKMAEQLIDSMTGPWKPEDYRDTYTDRVKELISAKKKGEEVTVAEAAPEATNVVDLMSALQASVEAAKQGRPSRRSSTGARKAPAREPAERPSTRAKATKSAAKPPAKATTKRTTTAPAKKARKAS
jgi:DNA end-binding protein Ku